MQKEESRFWELIEENRVTLGRYAYVMTASREDAKDLVSETVLAAYRSFPKLRNIEGFRKSLYTIAKRLHRKRTWRKRVFTPLQAAYHLEDHHRRESEHDINLLLHALDCLPVKQREAVLLFELSGLSLEEIRDVQGGSLSGVKSRVTRGREELRLALNDAGDISLPLSKKKTFKAAISLTMQ